MRLIVWGTGKLYQKYRDFLFQFDVIKLCDSNRDKQGTFIDGIEVITPAQLEGYQYDYIVVMTYAAESICAALGDLGVPHNKIILHSQLCLLERPQIYVNHEGVEIPLNAWIREKQRKILLISHNYSYTGIPVALMNMAIVLKKMGYSVLMAAMEDGAFTHELEIQKIDYINHLAMCYQTSSFIELLEQSEAVVAGSFTLYQIVISLKDIQAPVFWWIHETYEKYYAGRELPQRTNLQFLAGGNRVKNIFTQHYKDAKIETLQYCIPDFYKNRDQHFAQPEQKGYMTVAVIGTVDERKAQDILLDAVIKMPSEYQNRIKLIMIGRLDEGDISFAEKIREQQKQVCNLEWIPEMTQKRLDLFFESIDVLACPSRDDPMPIVVTQAMMHRKICVISEDVGQAEFIRQQENGFVFSREDVEALKKILMWLVEHEDRRRKIGEASRQIYEAEFSEEIMELRLRAMLEATTALKDV